MLNLSRTYAGYLVKDFGVMNAGAQHCLLFFWCGCLTYCKPISVFILCLARSDYLHELTACFELIVCALVLLDFTYFISLSALGSIAQTGGLQLSLSQHLVVFDFAFSFNFVVVLDLTFVTSCVPYMVIGGFWLWFGIKLWDTRARYMNAGGTACFVLIGFEAYSDLHVILQLVVYCLNCAIECAYLGCMLCVTTQYTLLGVWVQCFIFVGILCALFADDFALDYGVSSDVSGIFFSVYGGYRLLLVILMLGLGILVSCGSLTVVGFYLSCCLWLGVHAILHVNRMGTLVLKFEVTFCCATAIICMVIFTFDTSLRWTPMFGDYI
eukprot:gene3188-2170_t